MKVFAVVLATFSFTFAAPNLSQDDLNNKTSPLSSPVINTSEIVGGVITDIKFLPWQVAVLRLNTLFCGGSIIGPNVVLTAAHCLAPSAISHISQLKVRIGSNRYDSGGLVIAAVKLIWHPGYVDCDTCAYDYDIGIVRLAAKAVSTGLPASVILLWDAKATFPAGTNATVSGWGTTTEGGTRSPQLRSARLPIVSTAKCNSIYGRVIAMSRNICAGLTAGGKDTCQGDSGGPFVIDKKLAGVAAFGNGCAHPNQPGVYASVPGFRDWIRQNAGV